MTAPPEQLAWRGGGKSNSSKFEMDAWHDNDRLYEVVRGLLEELGWAKEVRAHVLFCAQNALDAGLLAHALELVEVHGAGDATPVLDKALQDLGECDFAEGEELVSEIFETDETVEAEEVGT